MSGPQKSRPLAMADANAGVVDRGWHDDKGGQSAGPLTAQVGNDGPIVGMFLTLAKESPRLHQLMTGFVNWRRLMMDGTNNGIVTGYLSHARKMFADTHPGHIGLDGAKRTANVVGGIGFEVPGFQLAWSAHQKKQNAVNVPSTRTALSWSGG